MLDGGGARLLLLGLALYLHIPCMRCHPFPLTPSPISPTHSAQVRKDERDGFQVPELTQVQCSSATSMLSHMRRALAVRQTRSHRLNDYSSRSHCIMTFVFASQEKADGGRGGGCAAARQQGAKGGIRRCVWGGSG